MRYIGRQRGSLLLATCILFTLVLALVLATLVVVTGKVRDVRATGNHLAGQFAAEAGFQRQIYSLKMAARLASLQAPFQAIDSLDAAADEGAGNYTQVMTAQPLQDARGATVGEYEVYLDVQGRASATERDIDVVSIAYTPTKSAFESGDSTASRTAVRGTVRLSVGSAQVFDYAYFVNHWGWFYGNTIAANGSVRANGQFDMGNYRSTINGSPRFEGADGIDLLGYLDDNEDGILDGSDGGIYSGFSIPGAGNVRGMGGRPQNQHAWQESVPMPNLTDLGVYEAVAAARGGSVRLGARRLFDGVLGDRNGEKQHLCVIGTPEEPIVIDGPVVVRGSVIIGGVVKGQGTIYAGGNIYVPKNLTYANPPTTPRPAAHDEASIEQWRAANAAKDALGLFARENIVVGDFTHALWGICVGRWLESPMNESAEDAGSDGIQNTRNGPDGIPRTVDDDVLEGDGEWTVSYYTEGDAALGLIPEGKSVGDPVPGTGEDIDGDGVRDGRITLGHFQLPDPLNPGLWEGNPPPHDPGGDETSVPADHGRASHYQDISTVYIDRVDAAFYTNHAFAGLFISRTKPVQFNGCLVSRNESIVYGAPGLIFNHDERLSGGAQDLFGMLLPVVWDALEIVQWEIASPTEVAQLIQGYATAGGSGATTGGAADSPGNSGGGNGNSGGGNGNSGGGNGNSGGGNGNSGGKGNGRN